MQCDKITAIDLYNSLSVIPGDKHPAPLPIDLRSSVDFNHSHVRSAINISLPDNYKDVLKTASDLVKHCNEEGKPKYQWKSIFNIIVYDERNRGDRLDFVINLLQTSGERFISIRQVEVSEGFDAFEERFPFRCEGNRLKAIGDKHELYPSLICPGLFLGSYRQASRRQQFIDLKISHVVNCALNDCKNMFEQNGITYLNLTLEDDENQILAGNELTNALEFINSSIGAGSNVLVHCLAGKSRSAAVVTAYLIKFRKISFADAINHVRRCRVNIDINAGFLRQLKAMADEFSALNSKSQAE